MYVFIGIYWVEVNGIYMNIYECSTAKSPTAKYYLSTNVSSIEPKNLWVIVFCLGHDKGLWEVWRLGEESRRRKNELGENTARKNKDSYNYGQIC